VINGIRTLLEEKKKGRKKYPLILLQFLVFKHNEHQIKAFKNLAMSLGADHYEIKSAQIYQYSKAETLIPEKSKYSRYKKNDQGVYILKRKLRKHCLRSWTSCVITWDGRVVPCCYDKNASFTMGNVIVQDLKRIWKSGQFAGFRKRILKNRKQIHICQNCQEGTHILR
jgi:radical SAM protein with 4Fe4S-binding SPASM domain